MSCSADYYFVFWSGSVDYYFELSTVHILYLEYYSVFPPR
jgi:hypothetical protein